MASIVKRPNRPKPWLVQWREPESKQQKWAAFETKREAQDFRDTVSQDIRHGAYQPVKPIPFAAWAESWLARRSPTVRSKTRELYEWAVARLTTAFGKTPIQNLRAEQIEAWQAELLQAHQLSPRSIQILRTTLGTILADARRKKRLTANPMEMVERFEVPKRELRYLTVEQLGLVCQAAGPLYGVLFLLQALCGLRTGEATGLQWPDLDLDGGRLFIRRQVIWQRGKDLKDRPAGTPRWAFVEPKSDAGKRVVELPAPVIPFLHAHRAQQNGGPNPHHLLFCTREGTPLEGNNIRRRHFRPILAGLGIAGIRPHDFRRTFIALHVEAGTHPKLVQSRVGHSDIRLTMDTYGKLAGEMALSVEQTTRFNGLATKALLEFKTPCLVNIGKHEAPKQAEMAGSTLNYNGG